MPHCNDWIPLGLLLGLLPLLGFWQHRDNKNHEDQKSEEKENSRPASIRPARFYRQNPYFVVDIPLENAGAQQQRVTHVLVGSRSASSNDNLFAVDSFSLDNGGRELRGLPVVDPGKPDGPLIPGAVHSWAQRLSGPPRLRVWRLIGANLAADRAAFNDLNFQLLNIRGTNSRVLNRVQLPTNVPPVYSNMIPYDHIPLEPPNELEYLGWDPLFDFQPLLQPQPAHGQHILSFTPPESYLENRPLSFRAYRFQAPFNNQPVVPGPPRDVVIMPPVEGRVQVVFTNNDTTDTNTDIFAVEMLRNDGNRIVPVGFFEHTICFQEPDSAECKQWICAVAPQFCGEGAGPQQQARRQTRW